VFTLTASLSQQKQCREYFEVKHQLQANPLGRDLGNPNKHNHKGPINERPLAQSEEVEEEATKKEGVVDYKKINSRSFRLTKSKATLPEYFLSYQFQLANKIWRPPLITQPKLKKTKLI
jgi:hypothetical protein